MNYNICQFHGQYYPPHEGASCPKCSNTVAAQYITTPQYYPREDKDLEILEIVRRLEAKVDELAKKLEGK